MIGALLLCSLSAVAAVASDSYCVVAGTPTAGAGDCSTGQVFLKGDFMEVGLHNAFSFGTSENAPTGYTYAGKPLGFIADYDENGWAGSPGYAGDFFLPGAPLEGWSVSYDGTLRVNAARMGTTDIPTSSLEITSTATEQSAVWTGIIDDLIITQRVSFANEDIAITVDVTMTNNGSAAMNDVWLARYLDPDQEAVFYGSYSTINYVRYQASGPADYINSANPSESLVFAMGSNNEAFLLALRSFSPLAHVRHGGFADYDPIDLFVSGGTKDLWQGYGGSDVVPLHENSGNMHVADEAIQIGFEIGTLNAGENVSFSYEYALSGSGLVSGSSSGHIYVQLTDIHGDGWGDDLYLAVSDHNASYVSSRRLDAMEPVLYSLHCACKVVRLYSDSGNMTISLHRNTSAEPGPRGKHVPFEWEALWLLGYSDGTTNTDFDVYGGVNTVIEIRNWELASISKNLDADVTSSKNKCVPPPPPKPSPKPKPEHHGPPPPPTAEVLFTVYESGRNGWCDDSGAMHNTSCSKESFFSPNPDIPNILTYPRYFIADHDGRLLLEEGTMLSGAKTVEKSVTLLADGEFVFSVSGHYSYGNTLTWSFCGVPGGLNQRLYFRMRNGLCEAMDLDPVDESLSCDNEWSTGMLLASPIAPITASATLQNERFALGVMELVAGALGLVALVIVMVQLRKRFPVPDSASAQGKWKSVQFETVDATEHSA
jgi:hypothetical protein